MSCDYAMTPDHFGDTDVTTRLKNIIEHDRRMIDAATGLSELPNKATDISTLMKGVLERERRAIEADRTEAEKTPPTGIREQDIVRIDYINHPPYYTQHPSGVECIQITEHFNFCIGNAIKYLWRRGKKDSEIKDLEKAAWYINREIERIKKMEDK